MTEWQRVELIQDNAPVNAANPLEVHDPKPERDKGEEEEKEGEG